MTEFGQPRAENGKRGTQVQIVASEMACRGFKNIAAIFIGLRRRHQAIATPWLRHLPFDNHKLRLLFFAFRLPAFCFCPEVAPWIS